MAKEWQVCPETKDLIEKLVEKFPTVFTHVNTDHISCIIATGGQAPQQGNALAKISTINSKVKTATGTPYDFILEVYEANWYEQDLRQKQAIVFHELMHIDPDSEEDAPKLRKHDLEDFYQIMNVWGIDYLHNSQLPDLLDDSLSEEDYGFVNVRQ